MNFDTHILYIYNMCVFVCVGDGDATLVQTLLKPMIEIIILNDHRSCTK